MRRLPIFFVIDVSESMIGEPIAEVSAGIRGMITDLRQNPHALDTAYISVIVFAGKAKTLVPLTDIASFYPPQFPIGGGTSLGAAIKHLISEVETKLVKNTLERKGDWKPIIFLFTDGVPTDDAENAVREWETKYRAKSNVVAISVGNNADANLLRRLTDNVLLFNDANRESYQEFFKWITASISTQSQKVESDGNDSFQIEKLDDSVARKVDLTKTSRLKADDNYVVLPAKCQRTENPYLIKFKRNADFEEWAEVIVEGYGAPSTRAFNSVGAFAITAPDEYRELSAENAATQMISTGELSGNPSCPCCGNSFGFSTCSCGGVHCVHGAGVNRCPWCKSEANYGFTTGDGDDESDIRRGLG
ncbi:MAG: VWA domain-containing protein [Pyrinomonadaceae bacterium]|nr:VWA domain-containing protein [Pyrinomonadaceae bacterium]